MNVVCNQDLWEQLAKTEKTVVMYGMGNGADKILAACAQKGYAIFGLSPEDSDLESVFIRLVDDANRPTEAKPRRRAR